MRGKQHTHMPVFISSNQTSAYHVHVVEYTNSRTIMQDNYWSSFLYMFTSNATGIKQTHITQLHKHHLKNHFVLGKLGLAGCHSPPPEPIPSINNT